jgi:hypothetical protein
MLATVQFRTFRLLSKNVKIKIYKTEILPAALQLWVRTGLLTLGEQNRLEGVTENTYTFDEVIKGAENRIRVALWLVQLANN